MIFIYKSVCSIKFVLIVPYNIFIPCKYKILVKKLKNKDNLYYNNLL